MKILSKLSLVAVLVGLNLLAGCAKKEQPLTAEERQAIEQMHLSQVEEIAKLYPDALSTSSGLHYIVESEGSGDSPKQGQVVTAHYHGTLLDGEVFDSSVEKGRPFSFPVGMGRVIPGWDEAFLSMKKGEKRKLILPSNIAYGTRSAGKIKPNSVLVFDVELLDFN